MVGKNQELLLGIDHIQLAAPAGCEQAAREFYGDILGLEEIAKPEPLRFRGGCWFRCGAHQIHIGVETDFRPCRKAHPAIAVRDLAGLRMRLAEFKVPMQDDDSVPGLARFYAHDPWGNRLEFIQAG
jgi:catechol 2,3-dioxygenase-like lactoylglutathione lyase family enzyme